MEDSSIDKWLRLKKRVPGPADFSVFEVVEHSPRSSLTIDMLKGLIEKFHFEEEVLEDLRVLLGPEICQALDAATPSTPNLRIGTFGEALSAEIYERWHAFIVPLKRLRITGGSPPGTDLLALRIGDDGSIIEVCYIECKVRTTAAPSAATDAYEQLTEVRQSRFPQVLGHLANHLKATSSPMYSAFLHYLASRESEPAVETYRISLTYEESVWTEKAIVNLQDKGVELTPLSVDVIKLSDLRCLIDSVYDALGFEPVNNDE